MTLLDLAKKLRPIIEKAMESIDDGTAVEATVLFPEWSGDGIDYTTGFRVRHGNLLYRVLQDHTSQPGWSPDAAPSLFAKVLIPDENVIPEWEQPESTNPYKKGDKVSYNGKTWVSDIDGNVWAPGVYGWTEVV